MRLSKGIDASTLGQIRELMEHTSGLLTAEEVGVVRLEQEYGKVARSSAMER